MTEWSGDDAALVAGLVLLRPPGAGVRQPALAHRGPGRGGQLAWGDLRTATFTSSSSHSGA
jgi:hypothetical protein